MSVEPSDAWARVCSVDDLSVAGRLERLVGRRAVLLLWQDGEPVACDAICPHAAAPLIEGSVRDGRIACARHLASFDLATGLVDDGWRLPPLAIHAVRVRDDAVEIRIV